VTNLSVKRTNDSWTVQLAGSFQTTNTLSPAAMSSALALLRSNLAGPPFNLSISGGAKETSAASQAHPNQPASPVPDWISRVTNEAGKPETSKQPVEDHFFVEGTMR